MATKELTPRPGDHSGARSAWSGKRRLIVAVLVVVCLGGGIGYGVWAVVGGGGSSSSPDRAGALRAIMSGPFIVFLTSTAGEAADDQVAVASVADPGRRELVGLTCNSVAMTAGSGICLVEAAFPASTYVARFFGATFQIAHNATGRGLPSLTSLSPTGRVAAATAFVRGNSYLIPGQFSTATSIFSTPRGLPIVISMKQLRVRRRGRPFEPAGRTFWGVTFLDDRTFYATMGEGSKTFLVRGDLARRTLTVLRANVVSPALSPDGRRIAFLKRDGGLYLTTLDLATGRERSLREDRSIDGQLAWLDPNTVLYEEAGSIWEVPVNGSGTPRILLENAVSPTVVP